MKRAVVFYRTPAGCPFENFLDSLPGRIAKKITWVLTSLEELDGAAELYFKNAEAGLMECRLHCGGAAFRILSFCQDGNLVILWGGILTKFETLLAEQLERALRYKNDFLLREESA